MERKSIDEKITRTPSGAAVMRADLTEALFAALFTEWAQTGYTGISLERVAARAGAGKAAIYRRWPSKLVFATEAINTLGIQLSDTTDHGSLLADIRHFLLVMRRALRHPLVRRILPDLYAEQARSSELAPLLNQLAALRRGLGTSLLQRAITRSELSINVNIELALDMLPSSLYWRMVILGQNVRKADIERQAIAIVAALSVL